MATSSGNSSAAKNYRGSLKRSVSDFKYGPFLIQDDSQISVKAGKV